MGISSDIPDINSTGLKSTKLTLISKIQNNMHN